MAFQTATFRRLSGNANLQEAIPTLLCLYMLRRHLQDHVDGTTKLLSAKFPGAQSWLHKAWKTFLTSKTAPTQLAAKDKSRVAAWKSRFQRFEGVQAHRFVELAGLRFKHAVFEGLGRSVHFLTGVLS